MGASNAHVKTCAAHVHADPNRLQPDIVLSSYGSAHAPQRWWRALSFPTLLGLGLRCSLLFLSVSPSWDGVIYVRAAEQLAHGEGYTLRIFAAHNPSLPTAYYPVGFPAILALLRLLGGGLASDRALQVLASTAIIPVAALLARRAYGRAAGRAAAWLTALWPGGILFSATWLAEPLFALGLGLALLPLAYARRRARLRALVCSSLVLGALAYVRPSALPIALVLGITLGFAWRPTAALAARARYAFTLGALALALALVPLAPWIVRNQLRLGAPVLVSTNGGVNLLIGALGDGSYSEIDANHPCRRTPMSEAARDRCYAASARAQIAREPVTWLGRGLLKLAHTFGHDSAAAQSFSAGYRGPESLREAAQIWALGLSRVAWLGLLAAALAGAHRVWRRAPPSARALLLAPVLALAGLHAVYLGGDRYRAAVAPMLLALSGVGMVRASRASARPPLSW